jgi:GTP cyclohydrolase IA
MSSNVHHLVIPRRCNEALDAPLDAHAEAAMIAAASGKLEELLDVLHIDYQADHNTRDTAGRVAKMMVKELLRGRFSPLPKITDFDNAEGYDGLIVTGPLEVRSTCAHHLMPIIGEAYIGILPSADGKVLGLSKYDRVVDHFSARLQIQEELVKQIGNFLFDRTKARGIAVRISAIHMCKTHRGVRASMKSRMSNTAFYGEFLADPALKSEFLQECMSLERSNSHGG